jgi:hypothetical protein
MTRRTPGAWQSSRLNNCGCAGRARVPQLFTAPHRSYRYRKIFSVSGEESVTSSAMANARRSWLGFCSRVTRRRTRTPGACAIEEHRRCTSARRQRDRCRSHCPRADSDTSAPKHGALALSTVRRATPMLALTLPLPIRKNFPVVERAVGAVDNCAPVSLVKHRAVIQAAEGNHTLGSSLSLQRA